MQARTFGAISLESAENMQGNKTFSLSSNWLMLKYLYKPNPCNSERVHCWRHSSQISHNPKVVPLNVAVKDTDEDVIDQIVGQSISDPVDTIVACKMGGLWGVWRHMGTFSQHSSIKDVEVFHAYCAANKLKHFIPQKLFNRLREKKEDGHTKRAKWLTIQGTR